MAFNQLLNFIADMRQGMKHLLMTYNTESVFAQKLVAACHRIGYRKIELQSDCDSNLERLIGRQSSVV